jgi:hypothetical protein
MVTARAAFDGVGVCALGVEAGGDFCGGACATSVARDSAKPMIAKLIKRISLLYVKAAKVCPLHTATPFFVLSPAERWLERATGR